MKFAKLLATAFVLAAAVAAVTPSPVAAHEHLAQPAPSSSVRIPLSPAQMSAVSGDGWFGAIVGAIVGGAIGLVEAGIPGAVVFGIAGAEYGYNPDACAGDAGGFICVR